MAKTSQRRTSKRRTSERSRPTPRDREFRSRRGTQPEHGGSLDLEAFALMLLAAGLLLAATTFAPPSLRWPLSSLREFLFSLLGWGMYLTPVPLLLPAALIFARREFRSVARAVLGASIVVLGALLLTALFRPAFAGSLFRGLSSIIKPLGPIAPVVPAVMIIFGLETLFGIALLTTPKVLARGVALTLTGLFGGAGRTVGGAVGMARGGATRLLSGSGLRGALDEHLRDLEELRQLYPSATELRPWMREAEAALKHLPDMNETEIEHLRDDLEAWADLTASFTAGRAKELSQALKSEDSGVSSTLSEVKKELKPAAPGGNPAARALESTRRALLLDVGALEDAARRLKRDREHASTLLSQPVRPHALSVELERHGDRIDTGKDVLERTQKLLERARQYAGWPEFVKAFERVPEPAVLEFVELLATRLRREGASAWPDLESVKLELEALRQKLADEALIPVVPGVIPSVVPSATPGLHSSVPNVQNALFGAGFSQPQTNDKPVYEALFEMEYPGGNHVNGEDIERMEGKLETVNIKPERVLPELNAPQVSIENPDHAPWDAPVNPNAAVRPNAPGIADSGVGERLGAPTIPTRGGIPIQLPPHSLLDPLSITNFDAAAFDRDARLRGAVINEAFKNFGINAQVVEFARGPTVTRFEVEPAPGERISRVQTIQNDLARVLKVGGVRIEAPVPGKDVVGLEVPNVEREPVTFRAGLETQNYAGRKAKLPLLLGKAIDGEMVVGDLGKMPHLLIAGSTGSGKSVCVNTLIMSLLFRYLPSELRFVMVDPKMVELTPYDGIPHLVRPVVTNPSDAAGVLLGCVAHMERRYKMMSEIGAKNLEQYNEKVRESGDPELPYLVIIIDELADLMITSPKEVESAIMRLAQMARATGMHLVLATQRPSADVVTGLIKVNVPARVAFSVSSGIDSRTILDTMGAERLTGYGDMLFYQPGLVKPIRLQGPYISEAELARITEFLRRQFFDDDFGEAYGTDFDGIFEQATTSKAEDIDFSDPLIKRAAEVVIDEGEAAVSRLQRRLSVGHSRAGKLIDALEAMGIVGPYKGSKTRDVLISRDQMPEYFGGK